MIKLKSLIKEVVGKVDTYELQNHDDLKLLINAVKKTLNIDVETRLGSASGSSQSGERYDGFYLRTRDIRYWDDNSQKDLKKAFEETNQQTTIYTFELRSTDDWEEEPGERTWDASFIFSATPKVGDDDNDKKSKFKKTGETMGFDMRGIK